jgi:hypothetical protein
MCPRINLTPPEQLAKQLVLEGSDPRKAYLGASVPEEVDPVAMVAFQPEEGAGLWEEDHLGKEAAPAAGLGLHLEAVGAAEEAEVVVNRLELASNSHHPEGSCCSHGH